MAPLLYLHSDPQSPEQGAVTVCKSSVLVKPRVETGLNRQTQWSGATVSVVMSVYNGGSSLAATLDSILAQEGVAFEFIVVDDGSTDGSGALLDDYARRDERLRVIHQDNRGLTRALIRGCAAARGPFIARQDAGDISLPGRLARQSAFLESNPEVVLTACGTRFVGPAGELLYEQVQHGDELQRGLEQLDSKRIRGPSHHGSVMFRRAHRITAA